MKDLH